MPHPIEVPAWLLSRLYLKSGVLNDERTAVICGLEEEPMRADTFSIDLTMRADWEEIKRRLDEEGFGKPKNAT